MTTHDERIEQLRQDPDLATYIKASREMSKLTQNFELRRPVSQQDLNNANIVLEASVDRLLEKNWHIFEIVEAGSNSGS